MDALRISRRLITGFISLTILFAVADGIGQAQSPAASRKNVILIVTDDQSPTLGCYGDPVAKTPNIDALAAEGIRFTNAFATTASCSASRSVILTGLHNHTNGQYGHQHHYHKFAAYHDVVSLSLPMVLSQHGYRTARIGKFHIGPEQAFQFDKKLSANVRNPVLMAEGCRQFLSDDARGGPFFLYFNPSDPHRSGAVNRKSESELKPNLFGNQPNRIKHFEVDEVFYQPQDVPVPGFLTDSTETREELAQYYQSVSRIDQGVGRLIAILKELQLYDKTLIIVTSDHGMAFAGAKTTVYDAGLRVPLLVLDPERKQPGAVCEALVSHVDLTPTLVDFAEVLDTDWNGPKDWKHPDSFLQDWQQASEDNRAGGNVFRSYQGKSWLPLLTDATAPHRDLFFASHTFHEIQMYYPMRVVRDTKYKLIWNIAYKLDFPFATDLWQASSWQAQYQQGPNAKYGCRTVLEYIRRPQFELYDVRTDPDECNNLANQPGFVSVLSEYKEKLRQQQTELADPWISKWDYE